MFGNEEGDFGMSEKVDSVFKKSIDDVARDTPGYRAVLTRHEAIDVARRVLTLFPVTAAALFGSFSRDEQDDGSDLDFLISFAPSARVRDVEDVRVALEYATGREVDVVTTLDGQTRRFRDSATRDGVRIIG